MSNNPYKKMVELFNQLNPAEYIDPALLVTCKTCGDSKKKIKNPCNSCGAPFISSEIPKEGSYD